MNCEFCNNSKKFEELKIKEFKHWTVYLHSNQCYLGRCVVKLKRHLEDFFDISEEELKEFFEVSRKLRNAVKKSFSAEIFNYASLGNITRHVHLHFIPRYSKKVNFAGLVFEDKRWGQNYVPYDKKFKVPKEVLTAIKNEIITRLKKARLE